MPIRIQITPEDQKRAKLVKPGWYVTFLKDVTLELNSKKDANNVVIDAENADRESEFFGVPVKHWMSEKVPHMAGGIVGIAKAFDPSMPEDKIVDVEFEEFKGKYIYAKWETNRGKDGQDPPRNAIVDWAPLPSKLRHLNEGAAVAAGSGETFEKV